MHEYKTVSLSFHGQAEPSKGLIKRTFFPDGVPVAVDTAQLDTLINEQAADGWELVAHSPLTSTEHITFFVTFKKAK